MTSKKRGGLSKREYAAAQKAKATPKLSSLAVASKAPVATGPAVGPLMTGQVRANSGPAVGPLLTGQTRNEASTRELASRAQKKSSNSGLSGGKGLTFGASGGGTTTDFRGTLGNGLSSNSVKTAPAPDTIRAGGGGIFDRLLNKGIGAMGALGQQSYRNGVGQAAPTTFMSGADRQDNINDIFGIKTASADDGMSRLGMALQKADTPDMPQEAGQSNVDDIFGDLGQPTAPQPFNTARSRQTQPMETPQKEERTNPWGDMSNESAPQAIYEPTQEEITQQQNELYGGGSMTDTSSGTTGNRSGRGSGNFGTGKGVMSDDPYIKELRKAYSSNGGEKWLRKQFEELIAALDPTYAQLQKEGEDSLNAKLLNDNTQLASVMNAGNVGDSEQRAQLMAQQQQSSQTALGNLLAKLAQNKVQDVSGYKSQQAEAMSKLQQNKQQDARTLLEKIQAYRGQQGQGAGRVAGPAVQKTPKLSRNDVFNWVEDALNKGYSWQEIADNAQEQGIGTETGGYLDQLLNQANKQNRYR